MKNTLTGCMWLLLLFINHVKAGETTCSDIADIREHTLTPNVKSIEVQDDREWAGQSAIKMVDPASMKLNGAEFALHDDDDSQTPGRATFTCAYVSVNLALQYLQVQPPFSEWTNRRCESLALQVCKLINADDFSLSF
ncbi:DUF3757 domain-containing protein [Pseudomonas corrugata]|uniref:hypothetical protein n=1 Tax=Pseudomonas corrugata TaxID=47879 RepID=UPI00083CB701|nr:hypothetical protein [Pseudomonas corrugata]